MKAKVPSGGTLLGLYEGVPIKRRGWFYQMALAGPDHSIPRPAGTRSAGSDIRQAIYETLWHELAHHIGMNEQEVQAAERRKFG